MANVTKDDVLRIADVARLNLTDEEATMYSKQLTEILTFTEKINELHTDDIEPTTNGNDISNVLRADEPVMWPYREEALNNAAEHEDGQFKVPTIID